MTVRLKHVVVMQCIWQQQNIKMRKWMQYMRE